MLNHKAVLVLVLAVFGLSACPLSPKTSQAVDEPMQQMRLLETEAFFAFIVDNSKVGIHRAGFNGVASLIPKSSGNNLFLPSVCGLNYETISLAGADGSGPTFEPRDEAMFFELATENEVVLVQPETSYSHVSARITFRIEEPHYLHQRIALTFHKRFVGDGEKQSFSSLWASYIHAPPDRHIYLQADTSSEPLDDWVGISKTFHDSPEINLRRLPDRQLNAAEHLDIMNQDFPLDSKQLQESGWPEDRLPRNLSGPLEYYYGLAHGSQMLLFMFSEPERVRLAYSPVGGGTRPVPSPAWDYVLVLDDVEIGKTYTWDLCVVVKPFEGRNDVLAEIERYRRTERP